MRNDAHLVHPMHNGRAQRLHNRTSQKYANGARFAHHVFPRLSTLFSALIEMTPSS
jgi:hypothetical protein